MALSFVAALSYLRSVNLQGDLAIHPNAINEHQKKFSNKVERVKLKNGFVRYSLHRTSSNDNNPLIVCLHGIGSYSFVWESMAMKLTGNGFNVLTLDFYGRGFSDSPDVKYNGDLFCEQIDGLLKELKLENHKIIFFGHSMGGAVATLFASRNIDRISKMVLFAPAGTPVSATSQIGLWLASIPIVSEAAFQYFLPIGLQKYPHRPFYLPERIPDTIKFAHTMALEQIKSNKGYVRAYLSTLRHFNELTDLSSSYQKIKNSSIETLVFWGTKDRVIPYENTKLLKKYLPSATIHTLEETGHQLVFERPDEIEQVLMPFLNRA